MKNQMWAAIILLGATMAFAENTKPVTTADGMARLKTNLENAQSNRVEYDKSLEVVSGNVQEAGRAKASMQKQKQQLTGELSKNAGVLKKITAREKEISTAIAREKEKMLLEARQQAELEKMLVIVKQNQQEREKILAEYDVQLKSTAGEKKIWKDREEQLKVQEAKATQEIKKYGAVESDWLKKRKTFETASHRWAAETVKQQQVYDTYQALQEK